MAHFRNMYLGLLMLFFALAMAAPSDAAVLSLYWADSGYPRPIDDSGFDVYDYTHRIGRYDPATGDVQTILLTGPRTYPDALVLDSQAGHLYWIDSAHGLFRANRDGGQLTQLLGLSASVDFPGGYDGMALDAAHQHIYWRDRSPEGGLIYRYDIQNPGTYEVFLQGLTISDLAIDSAGEYAYWHELHQYSPRDRIGRINLATRQIETLITFDPPFNRRLYGIALDEVHGKLYWSMENVGIMRSNLDGSGIEVINDSVIFAESIRIDADANAMYWSNYFYIMQSDLDGGNVRTLIAATSGVDSPIFFVRSIALDPNPIPLPGAAWAGLSLLGTLAARRRGGLGRKKASFDARFPV